jgi:hypothetical protein
MRLRYVLLGLGVALVVAALVTGILVGTRSSPDATPRPIRVGTLLTPRTPLFGDTVTAQVEFAGDARHIVPGSVQVQSTFSPFRKIESPVLVRKVAGDAEYVVWTAKLRCLDRACLLGKSDQRVTFPRARVTYTVHGSAPGAPRVKRSLTVPWPALVVYSRIDPIEVQASDPRAEPPWRADVASFLDVTYRTPPSPTAAAALGLSALLGLGAILLVAPLRRREAEEAPALHDELEPVREPQTPYELALARLEASPGDGDVGATRRALELVARELRGRGEAELPGSAQQLAWSAPAPGDDAVRDLAASAREATFEDGLETDEADGAAEAATADE